MDKAPQNDLWSGGQGHSALAQMADLAAKALKMEVALNSTGEAFSGHRPGQPCPGLVAIKGELAQGEVVRMEALLARCPENLPADAVALVEGLAGLNERVRLLPPRRPGKGVQLWVELKARALPMSLARSSAFNEELLRLDALAKRLQENIPTPLDQAKVKDLYKPLQGVLDPLSAWPLPDDGSLDELSVWAEETMDFLEGASSLAVASPNGLELDLALAVLAGLSLERGGSLGVLVPATANSKMLMELAGKAPGPMVVPAIRLSLSASPYELGNEVAALLAGLAGKGAPVVFTGSMGQLQAALGGGQGAVNDPLAPVVRHVPLLPLPQLARFAVCQAAEALGGLPGAGREEIARELQGLLAGRGPAEQRRILPILAARAVRRRKRGRHGAGSRGAAFSNRLVGLSETLGGLATRPRARRSPAVQEAFTRVLANGGLLGRLVQDLLGQDRALGEFCSRLRMEALTRPSHQPLRLACQGTPGTGKSESAVLLASELGVPYVNIDTASMPDFHTAASQMFGSPRGIVMSHMAGRVEVAARHHTGCVLEISDLDHAPPQVRQYLGDAFLQMMETGEAQSATGALFNCCNLILVFTLNLPHGADEQVRKSFGFGPGPSQGEVRDRVLKEMKSLLSSAFLSRVGRPVLFDPLPRRVLGEVLERAVCRAAISAAERLGLAIAGVLPAEGLGAGLLAGMPQSVLSFGARAILEHGRSLAAEAFCKFRDQETENHGPRLRAALDKEGSLAFEEIQE